MPKLRTICTLSALVATAVTAYAQGPAIDHLKRAKVCQVARTKAMVAQQGNVPGTATVTMDNHGGWCWWDTQATKGSLVYAPTFRVTKQPAHGQLVIGEVNKRTRVAYSAAPGYVGTDAFSVEETVVSYVVNATINVTP